MGLKLFHTTGYSTLLMPGETRLPTPPGMLVLWASLWLAFACNVAVWRLFAGNPEPWRDALASIALIGGGSATLFSLFGWRRTLKATISIVLLAAALAACGLWVQQLPIATLWQGRPRGLWPAWASFLRWQVLALIVGLALVPIVWLWNHPVRRVPGQAQLQTNLAGIAIGAAFVAVGIVLLR